MYHYIVWANIAGFSVGLPFATYLPLCASDLEAVGKAIAEGAGHSFLYVTEAES